MTGPRGLGALVSVAVVVLLVGCGAAREGDMQANDTQEARQDASDASRASVLAAAETTVQTFRDLNPTLMVGDPELEVDDHWYDCSDLQRDDTEGPPVIQWLSDRTFKLQPAQATEPLLDPLLAVLEQDGWRVTSESTSAEIEQRHVSMSRDDITLAVMGTTTVDPDFGSPVAIFVSGPCIAAPDGLDDGKPAAR